jgi:hypothetical protein
MLLQYGLAADPYTPLLRCGDEAVLQSMVCDAEVFTDEVGDGLRAAQAILGNVVVGFVRHGTLLDLTRWSRTQKGTPAQSLRFFGETSKVWCLMHYLIGLLRAPKGPWKHFTINRGSCKSITARRKSSEVLPVTSLPCCMLCCIQPIRVF